MVVILTVRVIVAVCFLSFFFSFQERGWGSVTDYTHRTGNFTEAFRFSILGRTLLACFAGSSQFLFVRRKGGEDVRGHLL